MKPPFKTGCLLLLSLAAGIGCSSVPEVESRLSTLQFHTNMYVVQAGDTLESIAYRYRLSTGDIVRLNPGIGSRPPPGLRINVRPGTELAEAVRTRAGWHRSAGSAALVPASARAEPLAVSSNAARTSVAAPVVVSPVSTRYAPSASVADDMMTARADVDRHLDERDGLLDAPGYPREAIVPDDLVIEPDDTRAALDEELQRYVGRWTWPTDGAVARGFAPEQPNGQGVDIAGVPGQDVRAALDGRIVYSGRDLSGGGNLVIVRHDDDLMTTYSHTDSLYVAEDDEVLAGDPIASLGWNGDRESVLRFEVRRDGEPLDPMAFLPVAP